MTPPMFFSPVTSEMLPYLDHPSNVTADNERCVEVPIVQDWLRVRPGGRLLEVGNVLHQYPAAPSPRLVIDIAEVLPFIDAETFDPSHRFDSIVSISTLEHVGWDYTPQDPGKAVRTIRHLCSLLRNDGRMLVTWPAGHNEALDDAFLSDHDWPDEVTPTGCWYLRRSGRLDWSGCTYDEVRQPYDRSIPSAVGLIIVEFGPLA